MKCDVKDVNQCTKILTVEVSSVMVKESFDRFYTEISRSAKVPGFRPGKAPRNVLSMYYGGEAREEVLRRLLASSYEKALQSKNLNPIGYPVFEDIDFANDRLSYKAKIEKRPDITIKKYKGVSGKKEAIKIEEKEIDDIVERVLDGYAKYVPIEGRGIELGDFAVCDISSHIEGEKPEFKQDEWCEIQENDMIKNFASQTVGLTPGDEKEINVTISDKFPNEKIRGKKALFKVKVKEIKKKESPEITTDFLKEIGGYASVDEFRTAIRKDIEERKQKDVEARLERQLIDKIESDTKFDVPQSIIDRRLQGMVQDAIKMLVRQGQKEDEANKKEEEFRVQFKDEARRQVKVAFILDAIAELEHVEAVEADIDDRMKQIAQQVRQPIDTVREYYEKNNLFESLYAEIRNQKVLNIIKEHADVK